MKSARLVTAQIAQWTISRPCWNSGEIKKLPFFRSNDSLFGSVFVLHKFIQGFVQILRGFHKIPQN